jgi:type VI secretion system protein ImpF
LLDRLTDDEPYKKSESRDQRILSFQKLKKSVMRDLIWLFNVESLQATEDLSQYPEIQKSVLNYGIQGLIGKKASGLDLAAIEGFLKDAISKFEPRILPNTIKIRSASDSDQMSANTVIFEIEGEIWAQPMPERLYFKTIFDIELGSVEFQ